MPRLPGFQNYHFRPDRPTGTLRVDFRSSQFLKITFCWLFVFRALMLFSNSFLFIIFLLNYCEIIFSLILILQDQSLILNHSWGLSKNTTCLRGLKASKPPSRTAKINFGFMSTTKWGAMVLWAWLNQDYLCFHLLRPEKFPNKVSQALLVFKS